MTPAVETLFEPNALLPLYCKKESSRFLWLFGPEVLYVDLGRLVGELDLYLRAPRTHPQEHLLPAVEEHDVIVRQVVLAEVGTFLGHEEVALLVAAAK